MVSMSNSSALTVSSTELEADEPYRDEDRDEDREEPNREVTTPREHLRGLEVTTPIDLVPSRREHLQLGT